MTTANNVMTIEPVERMELLQYTAAYGPGYSACDHNHLFLCDAMDCAEEMREESIPNQDGSLPRFWAMTISEWDGTREQESDPRVRHDLDGSWLEWPAIY